jgi:TonB-linked SusC/RagA family outer membrane protein
MNLYNEALYTRREYSGVQADYYKAQKILGTQEGKYPMLYPNINWYEQLFNRQTYNTKANINVSGGSKFATYYVAGGYDKETGLLKVEPLNNFNNNIDINRFHIRSNVIFKIGATTSLDTRIMGRFERYNGPYTSASNIFKMVMNANPVDYPAAWIPDAANLFTPHTLFGAASDAPANPYAEMVKGYENRDESTISAQATLAKDLDQYVKGLKMQLKASVNVWNYYSAKRHYNPYFYVMETSNPTTGDYTLRCSNPNNPNAMLGNVEPNRNSNGHYYFEARINWDRKFGKHSIGAMTVGMMEEYVLTAGSSNSVFETLPERNLGNSSRFTYDFDERYFLEFSYGYNGSEKFAPKHRFGFFPAFGGGWLVSNESFYSEKLKKIINTFKIKGTYGWVGNDAIAGRSGRFFYLSRISVAHSNYSSFNWGMNYDNRADGYTISRYANPDITWEIARKLNLGIELGLFKDESLKIQADVFREHRDGVYLERKNLPQSAGFGASIDGNIGKIKSQGLEGSLDYRYSFNKDLWLTGRANFTYATNEWIALDEVNYTDAYRSQIGHSTNQGWGYVAERLFVDQAEINASPSQPFGLYMAGDIKYRDINDDGAITDADRIPLGYPTVPEIQYGFGLSTGFRRVDFSFFFQGNARVSFFINSEGIAPFEGHRNAIKIVADDYWSETQPDMHAFWPRLSSSPLENNTQQSSWWMRDGKFMRLKTMELGYNIPMEKFNKFTTCRIYGNAENLFILTPFKFWDSEMGSNGLAYPINRRFNIGVQVGF